MIKKLQIGSKVTILKPNELVPTRIYGTFQGGYIGRYAQYKNAYFLFIKPYRCRKIERVVITPNETAIILNGNINSSWRREELSSNEQATVSQLHRLTVNDFKKENIIYHHEYGQEIEGNLNFDMFADCTADYMCNNNIRHFEALDNEGYINYIKRLLTIYNASTMLACAVNEGYTVLENCIKKAIEYNY